MNSPCAPVLGLSAVGDFKRWVLPERTTCMNSPRPVRTREVGDAGLTMR